ncbi:MAG: DegV family protein [Bacillota bacterium]|nr:DegV family protein [Bacillota bacterium]
MGNFAIVTDSSCDLPAKMAEEMELTILPLTVSADGSEYANHLDGREISFEDFYANMRSGKAYATSAVNVGSYIDRMEPLLQAGLDILCLSFSSALSSTYNNATLALKELSEKYPERKLFSVDTLCASMGQGLLISLAVAEKRKGKTIEEVRGWVETNKLRLCHWFTVDDLNHLKRGGRISGVTALLGTILDIKPVMHVDDEGHLINVGKARGRLAALSTLVDHMAKTIEAPRDQIIYISHGDCYADAEKVGKMAKQKLGVRSYIINFVGPVIGAHAGPGVIAVFFLGSKR